MEASNLFLKHQRKQQTKKEELLERGHFLAKWKIILSSKKNEASLSFLDLSTNIEKPISLEQKIKIKSTHCLKIYGSATS